MSTTDNNNINVDKEEKLIYHSKTDRGVASSKRRYTIVGIVMNSELRMGYSIASENDQFRKELGRTIAHGRAIKKPKATVKIADLNDKPAINKQFMSFAKGFKTLCPELLTNPHKK